MGMLGAMLDFIDEAVKSYVENVFNVVAAPVHDILISCGVVGVSFIAVNSLMQFRQIQFSEYFDWCIKYLLILMMATVWSNFEPIYRIISEVPGSYGGALLQAAGSGDGSPIGDQLDKFAERIFSVADEWMGWGSLTDLGSLLIGIMLTIIAAILVFVSVVVIAIGKVGLAMAMSLAPLFIGLLIFKQTSELFSSWTKFTLGFAMIPLVIAGILGVMLGVVTAMNENQPHGAYSYAVALGLIVLACTFLMWNVPQLVQQLSGSMVGGVGGANVKSAVQKSFGKAKGGAQRALAGGREASAASRAGGSKGQIAEAALAGMRQNAGWRTEKREANRQARLPGGGSGGSGGPSLRDGDRPGAAALPHSLGQTAAQGAASTQQARASAASAPQASSAGSSPRPDAATSRSSSPDSSSDDNFDRGTGIGGDARAAGIGQTSGMPSGSSGAGRTGSAGQGGASASPDGGDTSTPWSGGRAADVAAIVGPAAVTGLALAASQPPPPVRRKKRKHHDDSGGQPSQLSVSAAAGQAGASASNGGPVSPKTAAAKARGSAAVIQGASGASGQAGSSGGSGGGVNRGPVTSPQSPAGNARRAKASAGGQSGAAGAAGSNANRGPVTSPQSPSGRAAQEARLLAASGLAATAGGVTGSSLASRGPVISPRNPSAPRPQLTSSAPRSATPAAAVSSGSTAPAGFRPISARPLSAQSAPPPAATLHSSTVVTRSGPAPRAAPVVRQTKQAIAPAVSVAAPRSAATRAPFRSWSQLRPK
jgi:type IV secretion system protein VirB6